VRTLRRLATKSPSLRPECDVAEAYEGAVTRIKRRLYVRCLL
jgi:hypothetical protein